MVWEAGTQIGAYEIVAPLGAGGMGEVYRARDTRLQRDVALKVLPASLLHDPERRARFEREARVLASLAHPNVASIHGLEDAAGTPVLVLEFVEGRTLADRIASGPVPRDEALSFAAQIAEGLEAAHDRGVMHRDLKPANVQITPDGIAKILDFGLAKALDPIAGAHDDSAQSPTITSASTRFGVVLGTAAYMAPEQARGRTVDRRADIWAFGAVLFEMLSGRRAFPGETMSDTIAAVLTGTPEWHRLPADTPHEIRALLARCLERDPRQRLQSIGEARIVLSRPLEPSVPATAVHRLSVARAAALAVLFAAVGATAAWWMMRPDTAAGPLDVRKFDLALGGMLVATDRAPILSPDGTRIVYHAASKLWIRSLADFDATEVAGSKDAVYPTWSPDGKQLAFVRNSKIYRVADGAGEPRLVGNVPPDMAGSGAIVWNGADNFSAVGSDRVGILEISGRDGTSRDILALNRKTEVDFHEVSLLPDGRSLLFTAHTTQGIDTIAVLSDGKRHNVLTIAGENLKSAVYHPAGYLIFGRETIQRGVWAVRFSLASLAVEGDPFLVDAAGRYPSVASNGTLSIVRPSPDPSELIWIDRGGSVTPAGTLPGRVPEYTVWPTISLSPDGQRAAITLEDELWVSDLTRGVMSPLLRGVPRIVFPTWSPNGARVFFGAFVGSRAWSVNSVSAGETSTPQRVLPRSDEFQWPSDISPDGKWLLYGQSFTRNADLWLAPLNRPEDATPLMVTPSNERAGLFSPDGRWLAYYSDESGRTELYVRSFPIGSDREMLSSGGAGAFRWARSGGEIFYRSGEHMMSVRLEEQNGRMAPQPAQRLFAVSDPAISQSFAVSRDGQRFLFVRAVGSDRVGVILNWPAQSGK